MKCKHKDGWLLVDNFVLSDRNDFAMNTDFECDFVCNTSGCNKRIRIQFDVTNIIITNEY